MPPSFDWPVNKLPIFLLQVIINQYCMPSRVISIFCLCKAQKVVHIFFPVNIPALFLFLNSLPIIE